MKPRRAHNLSAMMALAVLGWAYAAWGAPLDVSQPLTGQPLGSYLAAMTDQSGALSFDDARASDARGEFNPLNKDYPNFSPSIAPVWIRFDVVNPSNAGVDWFLEMAHPYADRIDAYLPAADGGYLRGETGAARPLSQRFDHRRTFIFPIHSPAGSAQRVYLRIHSETVALAPLHAWSRGRMEASYRVEEFAMGVFFGVCAGLLVYNLFLWISLRDRSTLWYLLYLSFLGMTYAGFFGYGSVHLWPDALWLAGARDIHLFYFPTLALYFQFARSFLDTRRQAPGFDRVMRAVVAASAAVTVPVLFLPPHINHLLLSVSEFSLLLLPVVAARALRAGYRPARYYLLATILFIIVVIFSGLWNLGFMDASPRVVYLLIASGTALEVALFSLALADRIRILREDKERAEAAHREHLERSKETLERMVGERTTDLAQAKERAESATKLKDRFVELVSHDLRSPIGSIKVALELALKGDGPMKSERDREAILTLAHESADRLLDFIDHLLDVSRMRSGTITLHKRWVEMRPYVENYRKGLLPGAEQKGIRADNLVPEEARLFLDPALYGEALRNLISNAIKFCRSGDVVSIYLPPDDPRALAVKDTGPGIDAELLPNLFSHDGITTSRGSEGEVGTGLGLPHSFDILKAHGGELVVRSAPGEGATFVMRLPETRAVVLTVDDQAAHRAMMKEELKALDGVETIEADDGVAALNTLSETRVDLIITDIQMPNMDGYALIAELRKNPFFVGVPVIVATSTEDSPSERSRAFELGADDYVVKPVRTADFLPRVRHFIG